jgi:uncharacterized protein
MKVLVTGATGFVGKALVRHLLSQDFQVVVLTRNIPNAILTLGKKCEYFSWADTKTLPPIECFSGVEAVINLMGEGIADKRWSKEQKERINQSRIEGTKNLVNAMEQLPVRPKVFVSASGVGIYGNRLNEEITESSSVVSDFLGKVCQDWEAEAFKAKAQGIRVAVLRTGVVLGKAGGALKKMLPIFKLGMGGPVGSGHQYMSWIHLDDLCLMYLFIIKNSSCEGVFNATSAEPVTSKEFAHALGRVIHRPAFAPAPSLALKLVFGEMSQVLLEGQKVMPKRFQEVNYNFVYPHLESALKASVS